MKARTSAALIAAILAIAAIIIVVPMRIELDATRPPLDAAPAPATTADCGRDHFHRAAARHRVVCLTRISGLDRKTQYTLLERDEMFERAARDAFNDTSDNHR